MDSGERWRLGHRPALDGLRGVAVAMVLVSHGRVPGAHQFGAIGVTVFFTLSGFLITSSLLEEQHERGRLSLRRFYMRRVTRLGPALVAGVALAVVVELVVVGAVRDWSLTVGALTWTSNFVMMHAGWDQWAATPLSHTWSLAVEEQFYLLWPLVLIAAARVPRRALLGLIVALAAGSWLLGGEVSFDHRYLMLDTRACHLLIGAALAVFLTGRRQGSVPTWLTVPLVGAIVLVAVPDVSGPGPAFLAALLTAGVLYVGSNSAGSWLAWSPLTWLGERSYGVYIYHLPVLMLAGTVVTSWWLLAPLAITATGLLAAVSYRWLEEPVRAWGRRLCREDGDRAAPPRDVLDRVG